MALATSLGVTWGLSLVLDNVKVPQGAYTPIQPQSIKGSHNIAGSPTVSVKQIDHILSSYNSPMAGSGQKIHELGLKYGIDPVYALAFWFHESRFGTLGWAARTKNPGNIRGSGRGGWTYFNEWDDGMEAWFRLIRKSYINGGLNFTNPEGFTCSPSKPCNTLEKILPVYAPSSDGNDVKRYIASVSTQVDKWRTTKVSLGLDRASEMESFEAANAVRLAENRTYGISTREVSRQLLWNLASLSVQAEEAGKLEGARHE